MACRSLTRPHILTAAILSTALLVGDVAAALLTLRSCRRWLSAGMACDLRSVGTPRLSHLLPTHGRHGQYHRAI